MFFINIFKEKLIFLLKENRKKEAIDYIDSYNETKKNTLNLFNKDYKFYNGLFFARNKEEENLAQDSYGIEINHEESFGIALDLEDGKSIKPLIKAMLLKINHLERENKRLDDRNDYIEKSYYEKFEKNKKELMDYKDMFEKEKEIKLDKHTFSKIKNPKNKFKLMLSYSKKERDIVIKYPSRYDGHLAHGAFYGKQYNRIKEFYDESFIEELIKRGYNIETLKFSIEIDEKKIKENYSHLLEDQE